MFRNTPRGKPQWTRPVYPDMTAENIAWKEFLGWRGGARVRCQPVCELAAVSGILRRRSAGKPESADGVLGTK